MIAHVAAIKAALAPLGYPVHFTAVPPGVSNGGPHLLLWTSAGNLDVLALDGMAREIDTQVGLTHVTGTPEGVLVMTARTRAVLAPLGLGELEVEGWRSWLRLVDSRPVQIDRDVPITGTNRFPAYGVDMYRLLATPA